MDAKQLAASLVEYRNARTESRRARIEHRLDGGIQQFIHNMLRADAKGYQAIHGTFFEPTEKLSVAFMKMKSALLASQNGNYKYAAVPGVVYTLAKKIVSCQLKDERKSFHSRHEDKELIISNEDCEVQPYETIGQKDANYGCTELTVDFEKALAMYSDTEIAALCKVLNETEHSKVAQLVRCALTPTQVKIFEKFRNFPNNCFQVAKGRAHVRSENVIAQ